MRPRANIFLLAISSLLFLIIPTNDTNSRNLTFDSEILAANESVLQGVGIIDAVDFVRSGELRGLGLVEIVLLDTGIYEDTPSLNQQDFVDLRDSEGRRMEIPGGSIDGEDYFDPDGVASPDHANHGGRGAYLISDILDLPHISIGRIGFATNNGPSGLFQNALEGLDWARSRADVQDGFRIVTNIGFSISSNNLLQRVSQEEWLFLEDQIYQLSQQVILIAPAGNAASSEAMFPASHNSVIGVSALNAAGDGFHPSSNYGVWTDVALPGIMVLPNSGNQYSSAIGTSFSSYLATAIAGLIWLEEPMLTPEQVRAIMRQAAARTPFKKLDGLDAVESARSISGIFDLWALLGEDSELRVAINSSLRRTFLDQEYLIEPLAQGIEIIIEQFMDGAKSKPESQNEILDLLEQAATRNSTQIAIRIARSSL
jgi:subtilisin family serine protease